VSDANAIHKAGLSFVRRTFLPRATGLAVGFFAVGGVLWGRDEPVWLWALLIWFCFVWPLTAYQLALRAREHFLFERRQVLFDSLMGGFWIGAMQFNVLASVLLLSMLAMNNIATGGARMVIQGWLCQLLGMSIALLLLGFNFSPQTTQLHVYACIPMLVVHPITIGLVLYSLTIQLVKNKKLLRQLSRTDSLTGLANRGYWMELQERQFVLSRDTEQMTSLALIDIDFFKATNDTYGHVTGDQVLCLVSECIRRHLRADDVAGRYGGDEFCILLPDTSPQSAREVLERLRGAIEALRCEAAPQLRVSLSIGIAGCGPHLSNVTAWLNDADVALYQAKRLGRNQTVVRCLADGGPHLSRA